MKKISNLFKSIYLFFFYLTPKGKEVKLFKDAEDQLEAHFYEEGFKKFVANKKKSEVKDECIEYANKITKRKRLSNFHLGMLTSKKHQKRLEETNTSIDLKTLKFKNA